MTALSKALFGAVLTFIGAAACAAPVLQTSNGTLMGVAGLDYQGQKYNVSFQDGSCEQLFNGCDSSSDMPFTDPFVAQAAMSLLMQTIVDSPQGNFDSQPGLINGCGSPVQCLIQTPYELSDVIGQVKIAVFNNADIEANDWASWGATWLKDSHAPYATLTYALWQVADCRSPTEPGCTPNDVPEPNALWLAALGLGLGAAFGRKRAH